MVVWWLRYSAADSQVSGSNPGCGRCISDGGENDVGPRAQIWVHVKEPQVFDDLLYRRKVQAAWNKETQQQVQLQLQQQQQQHQQEQSGMVEGACRGAGLPSEDSDVGLASGGGGLQQGGGSRRRRPPFRRHSSGGESGDKQPAVEDRRWSSVSEPPMDPDVLPRHAEGTESVCCREIVNSNVPEEATCLTTQPTFPRGCLDIHALVIAYYALIGDHPGVIEAPEIHKFYFCD
ncbi:hypothetical protein HPB51_011829 [Rhipicephalus microplus]|uniref:Uncharacterized protein n=1 Tax=Rhipicephalus microplus TaxID=6941 RepID=A0A9J6EGG2_RHIMP|nr:hypothetical protein HPB51_011829 [Rhipicephalus microplus]